MPRRVGDDNSDLHFPSIVFKTRLLSALAEPNRQFLFHFNENPYQQIQINFPQNFDHQFRIFKSPIYHSNFFSPRPVPPANPIQSHSIQFFPQQQNPVIRIITSNFNVNHSFQQFQRRFFSNHRIFVFESIF